MRKRSRRGEEKRGRGNGRKIKERGREENARCVACSNSVAGRACRRKRREYFEEVEESDAGTGGGGGARGRVDAAWFARAS